MKNFKKLSILLLSIVMAFSCLAVLSLAAQEDEEAAKIAAIEALLEYYNDEGVYICDDFDAASKLAVEFDEDSEGGYTQVAGKTVWSATLDGSNVLYTPDIAIPTNAAHIAIVYSFALDAADDGADKGYHAIEFSGASTSVANADAQSVLVFDYKEGKAYFASMDADKVVSSTVIEGFVPADGAWYTVELIYTKKTNSFAGKVVAADASYSFSCRLDGIASLSALAFRSRNLGNADVTTSMDLLEIYEGSFIRSNKEGARQAYLDAAVLSYMKEYLAGETTQGVKDAIIATVDALLSVGYQPTSGSETATFFETRFDTAMVEYYWERFSSGVSTIDTSLKFDARMKHITAAKDPDASFPEKPAGVTSAVYQATVEAYNKELAALDVIAEYSKVLLNAVTAPVEEYTYGELLEWILDFEAAREPLLRLDGSYDDTYYGVDIAIDIYEDAVARFGTLKKLSIQFIDAVDAMNMTYATDFGVKYAAYMVAKGIVADPAFKIILDSYDANITFAADGSFIYDGKTYTLENVSADGKSATAYINDILYTLTIADYSLSLEGEGMKIVFTPKNNSGVAFKGAWTASQTVAGAYEKYLDRESAIIAGSDACKAIISDISTALLASGYEIRVAKRDAVLAAHGANRFWYEEGGKYYGYEGLADALVAFDAFCAQIETDKVNADKYIEIVIRLNNATTYDEIKAIVDEATPYSVIGNVEGYSNEIASVQEINKLFDAKKMIVVEAEGNAAIFVENVAKAAEAEDLVARLTYLRAAQAVFANLVDGATGVVDAKAVFEAEKASYLADAAAMNDSADEQGEKLVQVAFAPVKLNVSQKVVFIIKKIYEL